MVAKRVSTTAAASPLAKVPKREPADKRFRPALASLTEASKELPSTCVEMLRSALPHALITTKEERHSFQTRVLEVLASLHAEEYKRRCEVVDARTAEVAALVVDRDAASSQVDAARADEAAKKEEKVAKEAAIKAQEEVLEAAKAGLEAERAKLIEAQSSGKAAAEARQEYQEKVETMWEQLKSSAFDKKDWRIRNKAIDSIVACLETAEAPESLKATISVVLKVVPQERGGFGALAVEHAEAALKEQLVKLAAKVQDIELEMQERTKAIEAAEGRVKMAQLKMDAVWQACVDAENSWVDANTKVFNLEKTIKSFTQREEQLNANVDKARVAVERLRELVAQFEDLVECKVPGSSAPTAVEAEPAA